MRPEESPARLEAARESEALSQLVRRALALRALIAIAIHFGIPEGFFAPDEATYHYGGVRVAEWLTGAGLYPYNFLEATQAGYYWVVGVLYSLFGTWSLVPKLVNCILGAYVVRQTYRLARGMTGDHGTGLRAAQLVAYLPSMVLWSTLNIRDVWVVLTILVAANTALAMQEAFQLGRLLVLGLAMVGLMQFRSYLLLAVAAPIVIALVAQRGSNLLRNAFVGAVVASLVVLASSTAGSGQVLRSADLEILQQIRAGTAIGGESNFAADVDISTPQRALLFLPLGLAFFLFAPFPWAISGLRQLVTLPEMLYIYALAPAMVRGVGSLVRGRLRASLAPLLMALALTIGYALGQANAGTAYRHRAQVLPFLMILAAAGETAKASRSTANISTIKGQR